MGRYTYRVVSKCKEQGWTMKLNKILGIKYPFIQGGMANIATGKFAAQVSNSGALGTIGSGGMSAEDLRREIRECKANTDKPFAVNLMLMNPEADKMAEVVVEENVAIVTTGAGSPGKYIKDWKSAGIKVIPVVASTALAKRMEKLGVDAVIAEGTESGGHVGETTSLVLLPQVVDAVKIPVIAAGGFASGRQILVAKVLGAVGVQMGTCILTTKECPIHQNYKNAILKAKDSQITVMGRIGGTPVRVLKNQMAREYISLEKKGADIMELEKYTLGSLRKAVFNGDDVNGSLMAGQCSAMVDSEPTLEELFHRLYLEYEKAYRGLVDEGI